MTNTCNTCGKTYSDCRYPLSHAHATIDNVKVPGIADRIFAARDRRGHFTLQDRMTLNSIDILPFNFPTMIDAVL